MFTKLFNLFNKQKDRAFWIRVPLDHKTRKDAEACIFQTIELMEQKIIYNKKL
tara:strand:- start:410 stop:568 length:159 start_codon:yes stop_codon:yes gene_type:complete